MIKLAHNLGKLVVTEGVETKEQKEWLKEMGCDLMQGYYFSAPKSYIEIVNWLQLSAAHQHLTPN